MLTPTDLDLLQRRADEELSRRSVKGVLAVPIIIAVFYCTTNYVHDHALAAITGAIAIGATLIARLWLRLRKDLLYSRSPRTWRAWFAASVLLGSSFGGALIALASVSYEPSSGTRIILLFCVLSACPSSLLLLMPNRPLLMVTLTTVLGPLIVLETMTRTREGLVVAIMATAFLAFLEIQAYVLTRAYRSGLEDQLLLEHARDEAEAATLAKSQFLANVSHEIRTPMNGILGMTAIALDSPLTADQRECMETVRACADHLQRLLNDLLDFSKIDAERVSLNHSAFSPAKLVQESAKIFSPIAAVKGVGLDCEVVGTVPESVSGDEHRLRQILANLAGNAIKFTDAGRVVIGVSADRAETGRAELHFRVSDTGIGVPDDKRTVIFQPFTQADGSTTRKYGGTGLGLAISARLVSLMNGRIWVESTVGAGSTFHFTVECEIAAQANGHSKAA